jgi:hypothetical protein
LLLIQFDQLRTEQRYALVCPAKFQEADG